MKRTILAALCIAATMISCGKKNTDPTLASHTWELAEILVAGQSETPPLGITIAFNDSLRIASGNGGCNRYSAPYSLGDKNAMTLEYPTATQLSCLDIEFEGRYFGWLNEITSYKVSKNELTLKTKNTTLIFKPEFK